MIEQAMVTSSPLKNTFEKQIKIIEDQGIIQVEAWKVIKATKLKLSIEMQFLMIS